MLLNPTVLLYSPHAEPAVDYVAALEDVGYRVVRSATVAGCAPHLDGGADLILLDDPPWELARSLVAALDAAPLPLPLIWISSWSSAPAMAGKLGVDALMLEPRDVAAVVEQVRRTLTPLRPDTDAIITRRLGSHRAETVPELHPRTSGDKFDDESSDSWP